MAKPCLWRAVSSILFLKKNLDSPGKTSIFVLFAGIAAIFDLLGVGSSSNMKWKANAKVEDALALKFLPGLNVFFGGRHAPQHDLPL